MNVVLNRIFALATIVIVASAVVLAFRVTGPPARARQADFDRHRISDMEQLAIQIRGRYASTSRHLPDKLDASSFDGASTSRDPETQRAYAYHRVDATHFMLCAVFDLETDRDATELNRGGRWSHGSGKMCFAFAKGLNEPYGPLRVHP